MTLPLIAFVPLPAVPGVTDVLWLLVLGLVTSALMYVLFYGLHGGDRADPGDQRRVRGDGGGGDGGHHAARRAAVGAAGGWAAVVIIAGCALVLGIWPGARRQATGC